jgi:hypothetical protein
VAKRVGREKEEGAGRISSLMAQTAAMAAAAVGAAHGEREGREESRMD